MKKLNSLVLIVLVVFSASAFADHPKEKIPPRSIFVDINGLVCDFCARALEKVFGKQDSVENISVDLDSKVVTIHFNSDQLLDDQTITRYINDAGYSVEEIHRGS